MARVLHLVARASVALAATVIGQDLAAGDEVAVALFGEPPIDPPLPGSASVHRVPADWSYDQLLEQIFAADRVVTW
jgi:hypothetical protein